MFGVTTTNANNQQNQQNNKPSGLPGFGGATTQNQQFPPSSNPFGNNPQSNTANTAQQNTTQPVNQPSGGNLFANNKPAPNLFGAKPEDNKNTQGQTGNTATNNTQGPSTGGGVLGNAGNTSSTTAPIFGNNNNATTNIAGNTGNVTGNTGQTGGNQQAGQNPPQPGTGANNIFGNKGAPSSTGTSQPANLFNQANQPAGQAQNQSKFL